MSGVSKKLMSAAGGVAPEGAWDLSYAYYDPANAWDISTARTTGNFLVSEEAQPNGLFFKPDGTKMYVTGSAGDDVNEYDLSIAWDVKTATFLQLFSVSAQDLIPEDIFFRDDGLKMYILGGAGVDVNEYDLSTAWNVSTASFLQNFSVSAQEANPNGLFFKPDGTKMYVIGQAGDDVNEYDLSTAWDISTASFLQSFSVAAQETVPTGISFKPDGTKMYVTGSTGDDVNEYNLSTAWDVSTASFIQTGPAGSEDLVQAVFFKPDGTGYYTLGTSTDRVNQFILGGFDVGPQEAVPEGLFFKPDGTKMYIIGSAGDDVNEYDLSTAWEVTSASFLQNFSVSAQDVTPTGLFFKPDGTKMYFTGNTNDSVYEYDLSTAWDVSSAVYSQLFSVSTQDITPRDVFFKPDGLKMYVLGNNTNSVYEYDLSTAWNISTASILQSFSVAAQETGPSGLFFKSNGSKMYVIGSIGDDVNEYDLSTAWDVSTASFVQSFSVFNQDNTPNGLFFKPDGTQMFIVGSNHDTVCPYTIAPQE